MPARRGRERRRHRPGQRARRLARCGAVLRSAGPAGARFDRGGRPVPGSAPASARIDGISAMSCSSAHVAVTITSARLTLRAGEAGRRRQGVAIEIARRHAVRRGDPRPGESPPARLLVDSGASGSLTLYADFVAAHPDIIPMRTLALTGGAILPGRSAPKRAARRACARSAALRRPVGNFLERRRRRCRAQRCRPDRRRISAADRDLRSRAAARCA